MFCKKCGTDMKENKFCPECGAGAEKPPVSTKESEDAILPENMAGLLCYILGWVTGIVFIIIDKRPFVRFHAMQSIVTFGAFSLFTFIFSRLISIFPYTMWRLLSGVNSLIGLGSVILAVFLIVQAYKGKYYKLPVAGDMAERMAGKSGTSL
jgi:uncharacterized membrane protein